MIAFNTISIKALEGYFVDINKPILKFIWRGKRLRRANMRFKENNRIGGLIPPSSKAYYKTAVIKECALGEKRDK